MKQAHMMNRKTLKALKGSIEKWEDIVAGTGHDDGAENCPLCQLFIRNECVGCPVFEKTRMRECQGTPYQRWVRYLGFAPTWTAGTLRQKAAAKAELKFLKSLLPK